MQFFRKSSSVLWVSRLSNQLGLVRKALRTMAILAYVGAVILILLPNSPLRDRLLSPVYRYLVAFGLTQSYAVFTPYVTTNNTIVTGTVTLRDGTTAVWVFPRIEKLGLLERAQRERYRKWWHDNLLHDRYRSIRPDAARFVARQFTNPSNPPVLVSLQSHTQPIPPPPGEPTGKKQTAKPEQKTFYVYKVLPEDLK